MATTGTNSLNARVVWFCIGLGAAVFIIMASVGISRDGYDCGSVMGGAKTYSAQDPSTVDPGGQYGSSFDQGFSAVQNAKADTVNSDCSDAVSNRRNLGITVGIVVFAVSLGGFRLLRQSQANQTSGQGPGPDAA